MQQIMMLWNVCVSLTGRKIKAGAFRFPESEVHIQIVLITGKRRGKKSSNDDSERWIIRITNIGNILETLPNKWYIKVLQCHAIPASLEMGCSLIIMLVELLHAEMGHLQLCWLTGEEFPLSLPKSWMSSSSLPSKIKELLLTLGSELALLLVARGESVTLTVLLFVDPDLTLYMEEAGMFVISGRKLPELMLRLISYIKKEKKRINSCHQMCKACCFKCICAARYDFHCS